MNKPINGQQLYWRFKANNGGDWHIAYCTHTQNEELVRMGRWNGDISGGLIVSYSEIEWKEYSR